MKGNSFRGSSIVFATNHGKAEAALEPFKRILSADVESLVIDSDSLGTFSGEVERQGSMLDALRGKVSLARERTSSRFVLTSEGSFGANGGFGLLVCGIEMLMLHDSETGAEIVEQHICYQTNYCTSTLRSADDLQRFLSAISFGSHALVLYPEGVPLAENVSKGITDQDEAVQVFEEKRLQSPSSSVMAMSDMRAHVNPTRMKAIQECCELMAKRLNTECPSCGSGGFGLVGTIPGLACKGCGLPTRRAKAEKHSCPFCQNIIEMARSDGERIADPSECEWCNP